MRFDQFRTLIREKYQPEFELGNLGDSCAETCRIAILGDERGDWVQFVLPDDKGYLRHPLVRLVDGWDHRDFSNDQALPLFMRMYSAEKTMLPHLKRANRFFLAGTWTLVSPGVWFMLREHWSLLDLANRVQGWLLTKKYRWSDGKMWFEKTEGQVQDYLNMVIIFLFLRKLGRKATLPRPYDECMAAIRKYYLEGEGFEPNSQWIVDRYEVSLSYELGYFDE